MSQAGKLVLGTDPSEQVEQVEPASPGDDWGGPRYDRFVAATQVPLLILAVAFIPVLVAPEVVHLTRQESRGLVVVDWAIWAAFAGEYLVRLMLARRKLAFFRHNLLDLLIIALPMLRPLRVVRSARALRMLRLTRLVSLLGASTERTKRSLHARSISYVLAVSGGLTVICSVLMFDVERHTGDANIHSYGDALWWATTTISTVGYGDQYPTTAAGRVIAFVLILAGVSLFGVVTAGVAAWFVQRVEQDAAADDDTGVEARLDRLEASLLRIEAALADRVDAPGASIDLTLEPADLAEGSAPRTEGRGSRAV